MIKTSFDPLADAAWTTTQRLVYKKKQKTSFSCQNSFWENVSWNVLQLFICQKFFFFKMDVHRVIWSWFDCQPWTSCLIELPDWLMVPVTIITTILAIVVIVTDASTNSLKEKRFDLRHSWSVEFCFGFAVFYTSLRQCVPLRTPEIWPTAAGRSLLVSCSAVWCRLKPPVAEPSKTAAPSDFLFHHAPRTDFTWICFFQFALQFPVYQEASLSVIIVTVV